MMRLVLIALVLVVLLVSGCALGPDRTTAEESTTTTVGIAIPLADKAFESELQSHLDEALRLLEDWDQTEGAQWESFSENVRSAHSAADGPTRSVNQCIREFRQLVELWDDIYAGELVDFDTVEVESWSRGRDEPHNTAFWMMVQDNTYNLISALEQRLKWIDESLLWPVVYGSDFNNADRAYIHSWLMLWRELWYPLAQAKGTLDKASSQWNLDVDKAERPYRY
jgi:hypothetical protein